jgi:hypothetical protein
MLAKNGTSAGVNGVLHGTAARDDVEVVVLDRVTAAPLVLVTSDEEPTNEEMRTAEHQTPDGSAANPKEHRVVPWVVGSLATAGLLIAGASMYAVGGLQAAIVGVTWVLAGYGVAWIVVWGAAIARGREEVEIEERIREEHSRVEVKG